MTTALMGVTIGDWAIAEDISELIEIIAIAVITIAVVVAFVVGIRVAIADGPRDGVEAIKRQLGRGLLLGLDLLIAADIIRTVTLQPTLENVTALGVLVLVRTFLSWALIVELQGRWPWEQATEDSGEASPTTG